MTIKVRYNEGYPNPCRVLIYGMMFDKWKRGEVRELGNSVAEKLLKDNRGFSRVDGYSEPKIEIPKVEKYTKTDLMNKTEEEQVKILKELGFSGEEINKLKYESQRVTAILEKQ